MTEKRSLREVFDEARAQMQQWPESMKQLNEYRREEVRKLDESRAASNAGSSSPKR